LFLETSRRSFVLEAAKRGGTAGFSPFAPVTRHPDEVPTSPIDQPTRCKAFVAGFNVEEATHGRDDK
jgi:hypothetical protein